MGKVGKGEEIVGGSGTGGALHSSLYRAHSTLDSVHTRLYTRHSSLYTPYRTLYTLHFIFQSYRRASAPICNLHPAGSFPLLLSSYLKEYHSKWPPQATPFLPSNRTICTATQHTAHCTLYTLHLTLYTGWGMILKPRMILRPKPDDSETKTDDSATKSDSETKKNDSETKDDSATKDTWKPKRHDLAMNLDACLTCQNPPASGDDAMLSVAASVSEEGT